MSTSTSLCVLVLMESVPTEVMDFMFQKKKKILKTNPGFTQIICHQSNPLPPPPPLLSLPVIFFRNMTNQTEPFVLMQNM